MRVLASLEMTAMLNENTDRLSWLTVGWESLIFGGFNVLDRDEWIISCVNEWNRSGN